MMLYLQQVGGTGFALNPGLTGNWYNTIRGGEGFVLEFGFSNGELTLYATFYTYDNMGNQVWLVAQPTDGLTPGSTTVEMTVYQVTGPMWGDDFDKNDRNIAEWGTATFTFPSCTSASFTLMPGTDAQAAGFTELGYDLTRDLLAPGNACPTPTAMSD
jgi:hypothetical protein